MSTVGLLNGLQYYIRLLSVIKDQLIAVKPEQHLSWRVSLSYDQLTLMLHASDGDNIDRQPVYAQCRLQIKDKTVIVSEVFCQDKVQQEKMNEVLQEQMPPGGYTWDLTREVNQYPRETLLYLDTADQIARAAYLCSSGDNYRPGYYSNIIVSAENIQLFQINHWNSKSIAHKKDYHLRDLKFIVPLTETNKTGAWGDEWIGRMRIHFSDRSSSNNKDCGNKIQDMIRELRSHHG